MNEQQILLYKTSQTCLQELKSNKPLPFAKLLTKLNVWHSTKRALVWKVKESKKGYKILKLNAGIKIAKQYLDLLPTPTTQENEHHNIELNDKLRRVSKNGITHSLNLADTAKLFLTPQASDGNRMKLKPLSLFKRFIKHPNGNLAEQMAFNAFFPTPLASIPMEEGMRKVNWNGLNRHSLTLPQAVRTFPTPIANDGKVGEPGSKSSIGRAKRHQLDGVIQEENQGKLNPSWVEWLMGYPLNWTKD
jgi:hypothetical protein